MQLSDPLLWLDDGGVGDVDREDMMALQGAAC